MRFIWFLILCTVLRAGDCVSLTFDTMSGFIGQKVVYEKWISELGDNVHWGDGLDAWNKKFMLYQLKCIYSNVPDKVVKEEDIIYGEPHVWIGTVPKEMQAEPSSPDNCHCAILYLTESEAILVHTIEPNKHYIEHLPKIDLLKRTYLIYKVGGLGVNQISIPKT